jgi:hypothetical protein
MKPGDHITFQFQGYSYHISVAVQLWDGSQLDSACRAQPHLVGMPERRDRRRVVVLLLLLLRITGPVCDGDAGWKRWRFVPAKDGKPRGDVGRAVGVGREQRAGLLLVDMGGHGAYVAAA